MASLSFYGGLHVVILCQRVTSDTFRFVVEGELEMPTLPAVSKVVRVDHHMVQAGDANIQIREFYQYAGALSLADAVTWTHNIAVAFGVFVHADLSNTLSLTNTVLTDLTSTSAPQVQDSASATGTSATAPTPAGVAMILKKIIARRYRGGHPRVYLPGMITGYLTSPTAWNPASVAALLVDYKVYLAAAVANTNPAAIGAITHVNISYYSGFTNHLFPSGRVKAIPTPRVTPLIDTIINVVGNPVPGSQRRRNEQP